MAKKHTTCDKAVWDEIEEHMRNPNYVSAVYEFILKSIS